MHSRLFPRKNYFRYGIYYIAVPLSQLNNIPIPHNKAGVMSFHDRDHGYGTMGTLEEWARNTLKDENIYLEGEIVLVCMPRIVGYVFNPVSFWLCHDGSGALKAVLCEVHNTFGEKHTYICAHEDGRVISANETMTARKIFHVSPFLKREGHYEFRFDISNDNFKVDIDFFDEVGKKQLVTALTGFYTDLTKASCRRMFWKYPLVTLKATALIHYQALKLIFKGIRYILKPVQKLQRVSSTRKLTKL